MPGLTAWARRAGRVVDRELSRRLAGNTVPMLRNLEGLVTALRARGGLARPVDREVHAFYRRHAYWKPAPGALDPGLIARMQRQFREAMADPQRIYENRTDAEFHAMNALPGAPADVPIYQYLRDVSRDLPALFELFTPALVDLIASCLGTPFRVVGASAWRMLPVPHLGDWLPVSSRWHFDPQSTTRMRVLIALADVDARSAATELLDREASSALVRRGFTPAGYGETEARHEPFIQAHIEGHPRLLRNVGPPGSAILFNPARCLHRAGRAEVPRDMLMLDVRMSRQLRIPSPADPIATTG